MSKVPLDTLIKHNSIGNFSSAAVHDEYDNAFDAPTQIHTCTVTYITTCALFLSKGVCLEDLIISLTTGEVTTGEDYSHEIKVKAHNRSRVIPLPNLPADNCVPLKGDMWELKFNGTCDACLGFESCVTLEDLQGITIQEICDIGLVIESIFTIVCAGGQCQLATLDLHANRELYGDGTLAERCFQLTLVTGC